MIRGEISQPFVRHDDNPTLPMPVLQTVTVDIDVLPSAAKECLDLLLSTAYDFALQSVPAPF